jgi:hypothetical protein
MRIGVDGCISYHDRSCEKACRHLARIPLKALRSRRTDENPHLTRSVMSAKI